METKQYPDMECDVVIAGCGVAGLYAALNLPTSTRVIMLSKGAVDECDSMLAQGGICVLPEGSDYDAFFEDTMHAGHYENRRESVDIMIRSSRSVINDLLAMGVDFERKADGSLNFTREGAHSRPRIAFHADITGKEITTKLLQAVRKLDNVQILEHVAMTDILTGERDGATVCAGVVAVPVDEDNSVRPADELTNAAEGVHAGEPFKIHARHTLWATGGIGGVYDHSTNYPQLTGDACYIAQEHGIKMEHLDYVQIHPTGLFSPQPGRTFLISESCRGEGAILLNAAGERFTDELQPRDVVTEAIVKEEKKFGTDHVYLTLPNMTSEEAHKRFPNIFEACMDEGYDMTKDKVPVTPAQHYMMGGIQTDINGCTSMRHLYAAGETACNGVHGKNRLASNSLLESMVFAKRAADLIAKDKEEKPAFDPQIDLASYPDKAGRQKEFKDLILGEIKRKDKAFYDKWCNDENMR
mgnify:CR=1 FL=1